MANENAVSKLTAAAKFWAPRTTGAGATARHRWIAAHPKTLAKLVETASRA